MPRVYEKIEIRIKEILAQSDDMMKSVFDWAQKQGMAKVEAMQTGKKPGLGFEMARSLVMQKVRELVGLDKVKMFSFCAAPLKR